jgi:hypothetical protein
MRSQGTRRSARSRRIGGRPTGNARPVPTPTGRRMRSRQRVFRIAASPAGHANAVVSLRPVATRPSGTAPDDCRAEHRSVWQIRKQRDAPHAMQLFEDALQSQAPPRSSQTVLGAFVHTVVAQSETVFPRLPGKALHGALHRVIDRIDGDRGKRIHDARQSPLVCGPMRRADASSFLTNVPSRGLCCRSSSALSAQELESLRNPVRPSTSRAGAAIGHLAAF